ncbi:MAG: hypothetical protein AB7O47_10030 [Flavobacteriales bacterium]
MNTIMCNTVENTKRVVFFAKEDIGKLTFSKEDVLLNDKEQQNERLQGLTRAMYLGKDKIKVRILFRDTIGEKIVETTIWGVSEKYILLKGAIILPIKSTLKIIFY